MLRRIFAPIAGLFSKGEPSPKRITTHVYARQANVPLYSTLVGGRTAGTMPCIISSWWEARLLKGTELYKIQRLNHVRRLKPLPDYRELERGASAAQNIIWNGKKAVTRAEAVEALREYENAAMTGQNFDAIADKQPYTRYHWSRTAEILPQQIKNAGALRLKGPAPTPRKP